MARRCERPARFLARGSRPTPNSPAMPIPPGDTARSARPRSRAAQASSWDLFVAVDSSRAHASYPAAVPSAAYRRTSRRAFSRMPGSSHASRVAEEPEQPLGVGQRLGPRLPTRASAECMDRPGRGRGSAGARRPAVRPRRAADAPRRRAGSGRSTLGSVAAISARQRASASGTAPSSQSSRTVQARTYSPGCRSSVGRHRVVEASADVEAPEPLQGEARVIGLAGHRG